MKTLAQLRKAEGVASIEKLDDTFDSKGYEVSLKNGYMFSFDESHIMYCESVADVNDVISDIVKEG